MVTVSVLGIGSHTGYVMQPVAEQLRREGYDIKLNCADSTALDEDLSELTEFLKKVESTDILFLSVHGDVSFFRHYDNLKTVIEANHISTLLFGCEDSVVLGYRKYFLGSDADYRKLLSLQTIGGDENERSTLLWTLRHFDNVDVSIPETVKPLAQGVYVPGKGVCHSKKDFAM